MKSIKLQNIALAQELYGQHNNNLDKICDAFKVKINTRGNTLLVDGNPAEVLLAETLIKELYHLLEMHNSHQYECEKVAQLLFRNRF